MDRQSESDPRRFPAELVAEQTDAVLKAWGLDPELAAITTAAMIDTDLAGIDSHGISMLPTYEPGHGPTTIDFSAHPRVTSRTGVTARVDGGGGLGHPCAVLAMRTAIEIARESAVGVVAAHNSNHFGAVGHYAAMAAEAGLIGIVTTTARSISVLPARGAVPRLGTNPIAFAAPRAGGRPFLLDMSTSTVAVNKVKVYDLNDRPVPPGWVLDGAGEAVTDPAEAIAYLRERPEGGITALGGTAEMSAHKGYGLAVMVQILAGALTGATFPPLKEPGARDDIGHLFLVIDPAAMRGDDGFGADVDAIVDTLHATPPADPELPVLVAGEPEDRMREERRRLGIPIPPRLLDQLRELCERAGAPFLLG